MDFMILKKLSEIEKRLDNIEKILELQKKSSEKMDNHIDFIDNVYSQVKKPFCGLISYYNGTPVEIEKPSLEYLKDNEHV
jgi:hypothetical protein